MPPGSLARLKSRLPGDEFHPRNVCAGNGHLSFNLIAVCSIHSHRVIPDGNYRQKGLKVYSRAMIGGPGGAPTFIKRAIELGVAL